jgi:hypothetical protein
MTDISVEVDQAAQRAKSYWEMDGLWRINLAVMVALMALLGFWLSHQPHPHSWRKLWPMWAFSLAIIVAYVCLLGWENAPVMRWLKARITYPRTGYVVRPSSGRYEFLPEMLIYALSGLPGVFDEAWIGALLLAIVTSFLWLTTKGKLSCAHIIIPGLYLAELLIAVLPIEPTYRIWCMFMAFGVVQLFAGIVQLVRYLHRYPVARA